MGSHKTTGYPISDNGPSATATESLVHSMVSMHLQQEGTARKRGQTRVTINRLPDYALLEIFDYYREETSHGSPVTSAWKWKTLVHVCRTWRAIIFASPQRLHLRIVCSPRTPVRTSLNIWPPFPIAVVCFPSHIVDKKGEANLIAALEHRDRISEIHFIDIAGFRMEKLAAAMQKPFPALTDVYFGSFYDNPPALPGTFLGGFAPCLRELTLHHVTFLSFTRFVLNSSHIVTLRLFDIPDSWYISLYPEAMATCLASLPELESFSIHFLSAQSSPLHITPPPLRRVVLPALKYFRFRGVSEYLDDVISRVDAPQLNQLSIELFMDLIFDIPRLHKFISRAKKLMPLNHAQLLFDDHMSKIVLGSPTCFELELRCEEPGWQLSSMTEVCQKHLPFLSQVVQLDICEVSRMQVDKSNQMDLSLWREFFRPFSAVRSLYVSERWETLVGAALRELTGGRTMEVLPDLQSLSLDELGPSGSSRDSMEPFVAARRLSDRPIAIQRRKRQLLQEIYSSDLFDDED